MLSIRFEAGTLLIGCSFKGKAFLMSLVKCAYRVSSVWCSHHRLEFFFFWSVHVGGLDFTSFFCPSICFHMLWWNLTQSLRGVSRLHSFHPILHDRAIFHWHQRRWQYIDLFEPLFFLFAEDMDVFPDFLLLNDLWIFLLFFPFWSKTVFFLCFCSPENLRVICSVFSLCVSVMFLPGDSRKTSSPHCPFQLH